MSTPSAGATLYLIFIQVASRALTFIGNQVLLRYLSPTLLGIAVQLEVISVTVLYSARESLRVALQRRLDSAAESSTKDKQSLTQLRSQSTINLSYLVIALGLLIATASGTYYLHVARAEVLNSPDFLAAFLIYGIATIIELLAETIFPRYPAKFALCCSSKSRDHGCDCTLHTRMCQRHHLEQSWLPSICLALRHRPAQLCSGPVLLLLVCRQQYLSPAAFPPLPRHNHRTGLTSSPYSTSSP